MEQEKVCQSQRVTMAQGLNEQREIIEEIKLRASRIHYTIGGAGGVVEDKAAPSPQSLYEEVLLHNDLLITIRKILTEVESLIGEN